MQRRTLIGAAFFGVWLAAGTPAYAGCQGTTFTFCSKTFYATAACNGKDQLASITGNNCPNGQKSCAYCESGKDCPLIEAWEFDSHHHRRY